MAQDRIGFLIQRLAEQGAVARVIEAARAVDSDFSYYQKTPPKPGVRLFCLPAEHLEDLADAMRALWDAAYIELPDDAG